MPKVRFEFELPKTCSDCLLKKTVVFYTPSKIKGGYSGPGLTSIDLCNINCEELTHDLYRARANWCPLEKMIIKEEREAF